jgi:hypothetical protein
MRFSRRAWAIAAAVAALGAAAFPRAAVAGDNDLVLARLGTIAPDGTEVIGSNLDFRALASELGVVLAPRLSEPADTIGFGGFRFGADLAFTSISSGEPYWRVLQSSPDPNDPGAVHGSRFLPTVGLFARKGIWLPLPSFEVGAGAVHLVDSRIWAAQGYAKFALHEGYHDLPIPSVAVRGAASRMMGSTEIDLTIASIDVSLSKSIGLGGTVNFAPYVGWNWLIIVPRSEVVDKTPHIDPLSSQEDLRMNFVFKDQDDIIRNRIFLGTRLRYYVFALTVEGSLALAGSSLDDRPGTAATCLPGPAVTTFCNSPDISGRQMTLTTTLALDF